MKPIAAIPTVYCGTTFRSRLESRWAALFDIFKWTWNYEPFDLDGWIPDFQLGQNVLVEVKPYTSFEEFETNGVVKKIEDAMRRSEYFSEVLLLGTMPNIGTDNCAIGWLGEEVYGADNCDFQLWFDEAPVGTSWENKNQWDFCHAISSFTYRISGRHEGSYPNDKPQMLKSFWGTAGTKTQWHPRSAAR